MRHQTFGLCRTLQYITVLWLITKMLKLEQLQTNTTIRGIVPDALVTVVNVQWFGSKALELTYKTASGKVANELLYRHDESRLELAEQGRPWSFDGDGALFRLVSEEQRIRLAHLSSIQLALAVMPAELRMR